MLVKSAPEVNFLNILQAAFTNADPKSVQRFFRQLVRVLKFT